MSADFPAILRTHADSMASEGWYTAANALDRAAVEIEELRLWLDREIETQEALQKIGEEFGVHGGEPRVDGVRRVLSAERAARKAAEKEVERLTNNRDMWKGQCERQTAKLTLMRAALAETLAIAERNEAGDYIAHARAALSPATDPTT